MVTLIKLAGLWAVVSAGLVSVLMPGAPEPQPAGSLANIEQAAPGPIATDPEPGRGGCAAQTWPYVTRDCIAGADARKPVRTITAGAATAAR